MKQLTAVGVASARPEQPSQKTQPAAVFVNEKLKII